MPVRDTRHGPPSPSASAWQSFQNLRTEWTHPHPLRIIYIGLQNTAEPYCFAANLVASIEECVGSLCHHVRGLIITVLYERRSSSPLPRLTPEDIHLSRVFVLIQFAYFMC